MVRVLHSYSNHVLAAQRFERLIGSAKKGGRAPRITPLPSPAKRKSAEQVQQMVVVWEECRNVEEVARQVGADQTTVRRHLRKAGIDTAPRVLEAEDIRRIGELRASGLSIRKIEALTGWTRGSVVKGIRLYNERISRGSTAS